MKAATLMSQADKSYFEKIMPRVISKLQFADKQGIMDLMWVMAELKIDINKD